MKAWRLVPACVGGGARCGRWGPDVGEREGELGLGMGRTPAHRHSGGGTEGSLPWGSHPCCLAPAASQWCRGASPPSPCQNPKSSATVHCTLEAWTQGPPRAHACLPIDPNSPPKPQPSHRVEGLCDVGVMRGKDIVGGRLQGLASRTTHAQLQVSGEVEGDCGCGCMK